MLWHLANFQKKKRKMENQKTSNRWNDEWKINSRMKIHFQQKRRNWLTKSLFFLNKFWVEWFSVLCFLPRSFRFYFWELSIKRIPFTTNESDSNFMWTLFLSRSINYSKIRLTDNEFENKWTERNYLILSTRQEFCEQKSIIKPHTVYIDHKDANTFQRKNTQIYKVLFHKLIRLSNIRFLFTF